MLAIGWVVTRPSAAYVNVSVQCYLDKGQNYEQSELQRNQPGIR